jgi:hypothetical protein
MAPTTNSGGSQKAMMADADVEGQNERLELLLN